MSIEQKNAEACVKVLKQARKDALRGPRWEITLTIEEVGEIIEHITLLLSERELMREVLASVRRTVRDWVGSMRPVMDKMDLWAHGPSDKPDPTVKAPPMEELPKGSPQGDKQQREQANTNEEVGRAVCARWLELGKIAPEVMKDEAHAEMQALARIMMSVKPQPAQKDKP